MCGRFTLFSTYELIKETFGITNEFEVNASYNIAPSEQILAIIQDGNERRAGRLTWGLIPSWAKDKRIGANMINARGETIAEKPSFKRAFQSRRCIIPTNGFFEWKNTQNGKQPYFIYNKTAPLLAFASLWESWIDRKTGEKIFSCTIVTTEANDAIKPLHHRMPVILDKDAQNIWLNNKEFSYNKLQAIINNQFDSNKIATYPVSNFVNNAKNEGKQCIEKVTES